MVMFVSMETFLQFEYLPDGNVDAIVNFAGAMPAHMQGYKPYDYLNSIIIGTMNILEYAKEIGVNRIVFSQSISDVVYKFGSSEPIHNDTYMKFPLTGDHSVYSISKNTAVYLHQHYQAEYGIQTYILRLPTIYAYHPNRFYFVNGQKKWLGYRLLIEKAYIGDAIEIWGNPENKKELVYVKDFVKIVEGALITSTPGEIFNVANGFAISFEEQIKTMISVLNPPDKESSLVYKPEMPSSPQFILDVKKTKELLKYTPTYDCKQYFIDFDKERQLQRFIDIWGSEDDYKLD